MAHRKNNSFNRGPSKMVAIAGTGNFATNLAALCSRFNLETVLFVDEFRKGLFLGKPVLPAAELASSPTTKKICKWLVAISNPAHSTAAVKRLVAHGVPGNRVMPLSDDPALQILALLFEEFGPEAVEQFSAPDMLSVGELEKAHLESGWRKTLGSLDSNLPTVGLGYFGRGGGFRRHISSLIPLLEDRFNVMTMSDEVLAGAEEAPRHLYLSADSACGLDCLDLVLSAHVFPCSAPSVPRVSFSHVIYDFNLTAEYHAARLVWSETHYLFASSQPCFDWYVELVKRFGLKNRICIIPGGYLQLDRTTAAMEDYSGPCRSIIYAPTLSLANYPHSDLVTSLDQGPCILEILLENFPDRTIIFRPHPSDYRLHELQRDDPRSRYFENMLELCRTNPRCILDDKATNYLDSYRQSALMVSDTSSTAFTFAFSTGRPVVFFSPRDPELVETLGENLKFVEDRNKVGEVVTSLDDLATAVLSLLEANAPETRSLLELRDRMIFNPGNSARYFVENLDYIVKGDRHPDWHCINW